MLRQLDARARVRVCTEGGGFWRRRRPATVDAGVKLREARGTHMYIQRIPRPFLLACHHCSTYQNPDRWPTLIAFVNPNLAAGTCHVPAHRLHSNNVLQRLRSWTDCVQCEHVVNSHFVVNIHFACSCVCKEHSVDALRHSAR